ncbi:MAG TPA: PH domain-containing protein [Anaeromyxobacteraceae bacterium]|nr:PH domain-containing protein [Anaeromyxobacteraceae bacterium]
MSFTVLAGLGVAVLLLVAIPVLLAWSASRRRLRVARVDGAAVLRMPRGHNAILATIAILPCAAIAVVALFVAWAPGAESSGWILAGFMGLLGLASGGYLLALEARGCIRVDEAAIEKVGAFTRRRSAWADVAKVTFNPVNNWFFLTLPGGARLYVVEGLDGIADFADLALRHLPAAVLKASPEAEEALRELAAS